MTFIHLFAGQSMKLWHGFLLAGLCAGVILTGCVKKANPAPINGMTTYTDSLKKFSLDYPANWKVRKFPDRIIVNSDSARPGLARFTEYSTEGSPAAQIVLRAIKIEGRSLDSIMKDTRIFEDKVYKVENTTLAGTKALKITYEFPLEDGLFKGEQYLAMKDTGTATMLSFDAFSGTFDAYRPDFDKIIQRVKLAETYVPPVQTADTIIQQAEPQPPSATTRTITGTGFTIAVPDNFQGQRGSVAGTLYSVNYVGDRLDCSIQVDVFDASKQSNLDKIVEDNKARYKATSASATTLGGVKAYSIAYSFRADAGSRAYFAVKDKKMFRVTINWFKPKEADYLPAFEKAVASVKLQ